MMKKFLLVYFLFISLVSVGGSTILPTGVFTFSLSDEDSRTILQSVLAGLNQNQSITPLNLKLTEVFIEKVNNKNVQETILQPLIEKHLRVDTIIELFGERSFDVTTIFIYLIDFHTTEVHRYYKIVYSDTETLQSEVATLDFTYTVDREDKRTKITVLELDSTIKDEPFVHLIKLESAGYFYRNSRYRLYDKKIVSKIININEKYSAVINGNKHTLLGNSRFTDIDLLVMTRLSLFRGHRNIITRVVRSGSAAIIQTKKAVLPNNKFAYEHYLKMLNGI